MGSEPKAPLSTVEEKDWGVGLKSFQIATIL
jgi:hypothetical protein